jgi:acyl-CoA hydrolase
VNSPAHGERYRDTLALSREWLANCDDVPERLEKIVERTPEFLTTVDSCVERIFDHARGDLRVGAPLGLGKPNVLLNAIYARVKHDPALKLTLYTALSLGRPHPKTDLERRFLDPFLERQFGRDYPDLAYVAALHAGTLPANVRVHEFYLQSGAMLGVPEIQRNYICLNYTHVARDMHAAGLNVFVQIVAVRDEGGRRRYSLSSNPDITADLTFIGNDAEIDAGFFDLILDDAANRHTLFALPREPVEIAEFALGLHASTLVRDGGTLQIGIGTLSDALVHALLLRHRRNEDYRLALRALNDGVDAADAPTAVIGSLSSFERGLYGASEMVMDGFMHLVRAGILKRHVYDDHALEKALATKQIAEVLGPDAADALHAAGVLPDRIDAPTLARLIRFHIVPDTARLSDAGVVLPDRTLPLDLREPPARAEWNQAVNGRRLRNGRYLRGAFFLGSKEFYDWLRNLDGDAFDGLSMTRVSDINQLYGGREALDALQRRDARFFNICMMATALGAAVSDGLEDGQVVSGVGGQYNFVAMAHALDGGRSVLMLRSTRASRGRVSSNILWNYGHTTIPRHLRDIYVTEYGIADLRGKSDEDCILAMLSICDARFQDDLAARAKAAGKLRADFVVPARWRSNTPGYLARALEPLRELGGLPQFPFGSDFSPEELGLLPALKKLREVSVRKADLAVFLLSSVFARGAGEADRALLGRLGLLQVRGGREWLLKKLVTHALRAAVRR